MATKESISVTLVFSPKARTVLEIQLQMVPGSTVRQALRLSGWLAEMSQPKIELLEVGVWGRKVPWEQPLRQDDRVELYRCLTVDPKVARRERFARQGAKSAGLFAKRRAGAKAGY
jgi:putative ubiquitin-RnfH superfamily antitoxin RatB of RatAB toxin-antitoxin module